MRRRAAVLFLITATAVSSAACRPEGRGLIILCAGDSLTEGGYPPFLRRMLQREGVLVRVGNYGRSGAASGEYLSFLMENEDRFKEERPDIVLITLGTNDVRTDHDSTPTEVFRQNLLAIIERFRTFRSRGGRIPRIMLSTIPPVPPDDLPNFNAGSARRVEAEINPAIREIANAAGIPLVDHHTALAARPDLLPGVHPSSEGYRLMAETWRKAIPKVF
ncbi:MAG: SGNH/GDSL hydrolase family protein [Candidatus Aminicenantes bacterium]|nr:SGNH/GDSL hydrolase family protein [Candidatus Aminicenantes bacterium]